MLALCVDDEALLLAELVRAVEASPDVTEVAQFRLCSEVLAWVQTHQPDVAFLDIQLRGCTGLEMAEKLHDLYPDLPVVFCTGYREYAIDAFRQHASGYLLKPVKPEDVQAELDVILKKKSGEKPLTVQCFGNFEAFVNGKPLAFKRKRSKELLAYLVDRRGATVTAKEITAALWEDDSDNDKNMMYLYKLFGDLRTTLADAGAEAVLVRNKQEYAIDPDAIECDYYRYLAGDGGVAFTGEYMTQYPWAEMTAASLQLSL